ncbi:MAG: translation initiation factor IF-1A [Candidatus Aenigmarchaeota archaeon ex4484_56]|nr:MAG: translation initiation factor IF-1A [Candidatus Aenigmarchaeota archaeon ex4484_56]
MEIEEIRIRYPEKDEVIGIVEEKLGGAHFRVACTDGKVRLCRIPGAKKRDLWIDLDMVVLVKPWELQPDERGDIVMKYNEQQVRELKRKKLLD